MAWRPGHYSGKKVAQSLEPDFWHGSVYLSQEKLSGVPFGDGYSAFAQEPEESQVSSS